MNLTLSIKPAQSHTYSMFILIINQIAIEEEEEATETPTQGEIAIWEEKWSTTKSLQIVH